MTKIDNSLTGRNLRRRLYLPAVIIILALTLISQIFVIYSNWKTYLYFEEIVQSKTSLTDLVTSISTLDEALTMSTMMYTTTGDPVWEQRYTTLLPQLDTSINRLKSYATTSSASEAAVQTDKANIELVKIEKKAFELIKQKDILAANALLNSKEYSKQKQLHKIGLTQIQNTINNRNSLQYAYERNKFSFMVIISIVVMSLLAFAWLLIIRTTRKHETRLKLAEEALMKSENKFQEIFINLHDAYLQANTAGEIVLASPSAILMFGYQQNEEFVKLKTVDLYVNAVDWEKLITKLYDKGSAYNHIFNAKRKNNSTFWAEANVQFQYNKEKQIIGSFGIIRDISDRIRAEELLQESKTLLKSVLNSTNDMIWYVDAENFGLLGWNNSLQKYFKEKHGIELQKGNTPAELFTENSSWIEQWNNYYTLAKNEGSFTTEYKHILDGEVLLLNVNLLKHNDHVYGISVFAKDISAIRSVEAEIIQSRQRFQTMFEQAPIGITLNDTLLNDHSSEINDMYAQIVGRSKKEITEIGWIKTTHPDDIQEELINTERMNRGEIDGFNMKKRYIRPDNSIVWVNMVITRIKDENSNSSMYLCMIEDITNQKIIEDKIRIFSLAIEQSPISIIITDINGYIEYVNPKFYQTTGYTKKDVLGKTPRILKSGDKGINEYKELWDTITAGKEWHGEFRNLRKNGETYYESASISPIFNEKAEIINFVAIKEDITERKQAEKRIIETSNRLNEVLENAIDASYKRHLHTYNYEYLSPSYEKITGYTMEDMNSKSVAEVIELIHPDDMAEIEKIVTKALSDPKGNSYEIIYRIKHKVDGNYRWILDKFSILRDNQNQAVAMIGSINDISTRKIAEENLIIAKEKIEESEEQFRAIFDNSTDAIGISHKGISVMVNQAYVEMLGYSDEKEIIGKSILDFIAPKERDRITKYFTNRHLDIETPRYYVVYGITKDGVEFPIEITAGTYIIKNEKFTVGIMRDITDRKRKEEKIKESERNYRNIFENAIEGMFRTSIEGKSLQMNNALAQILGYNTPEEAVKNINDSAHQIWANAAERLKYAELLDKQGIVTDLNAQFKKENGEIIWVSMNAKLIRDNNGKKLYYEGFLENITERKLIEEALLENEEQFRSTFEQAAVGIAHVAFNGKFIRINQRLCDITGYSHTEMLSKTFQEITSPDFIDTDIYNIENFKTNKTNTYKLEKKYIRKNGSSIWVNVTIAMKRKVNGEPDYFITVVEDISTRKAAEEELRKFTSHLQNVREEEKKTIAREIHDDLGQILVAQKIDMGLLKRKLISESSTHVSEGILNKVDEMIILIDKTIKTTRAIMNGLRPETLEINGFIDTATSYLHEFELRYDITAEFNSTFPNLVLTPQQSLSLFRILQEALNNIAKYAKASHVKVNLTNSEDSLYMEIIDNGVGFDINNSKRKDAYGMIGMKERVILIDGKLDITSELGKGTCIKVEIPFIDCEDSN